MDQELPKIKNLNEVGEAPFQFIEKVESILQGWDNTIRRTIYLFKTGTGMWGYFDKDSSQVTAVTNWNEDSAWIKGRYIKMSLFHRIHVRFYEPLKYTGWDPATRKEVPAQASDAILLITDSTYHQIQEQLTGRNPLSWLQLHFTSKKLKNRTMVYVDKVIWLS